MTLAEATALSTVDAHFWSGFAAAINLVLAALIAFALVYGLVAIVLPRPSRPARHGEEFECILGRTRRTLEALPHD